MEHFIDTPVKRYSSGMYVRLAFAVAAHLEPEILIVDEVLAVGDAEFQRRCLEKMRDVAREGRTVLFVSHGLNTVQEICQRVMLLENGRVPHRSPTPRPRSPPTSTTSSPTSSSARTTRSSSHTTCCASPPARPPFAACA